MTHEDAKAADGPVKPRALRPHADVLAYALICAFLSSPGQTFFLAVFTVPMGESAGLGPGAMGALYMAATLGAAALLPLTGPWIDRLDLRVYTLAVLGGLALACLAAAGAQGAAGLGLAFLLLRLFGQGLMTHTAITATVRFFHSLRGRALAVIGLGLPLAEALTPGAGVLLIAAAGWRGAFVIIAAILVFIAAPLLMRLIWTKRDFITPVRAGDPGRSGFAAAARLLAGSRYFWMILPLLVFMPFAVTGAIFHLQLIAADRGWAPALIAPGFLGFAAGHALGLVIGGQAVDRFSAVRILPVMNAPFVIGLASLALFSAPAALFVLLALAGLSSGVVQTAVAAMWAEVYGVANVGAIRSAAMVIMVAGTAAGPAMVGAALEAGAGAPVLAAALVAAAFIASALAAFAPGASGRKGETAEKAGH